MGKIYWVVGGIIIVAAVIFIPDTSVDIWASVWLGSAAVWLYLIAFTWVWLKQIESKAKKSAISIILGVLILSSGIFGYSIYHRSQLTKANISQMRLNTEKSKAHLNIMEPLLSTMRTYYRPLERQPEQRSLSSIFISKYDSLLTDDNVFQFDAQDDDESLILYLEVAEPDSLALIGQSSIVDGQDPEFKNFKELTGKMQVRGILTPNGIHYERQN